MKMNNKINKRKYYDKSRFKIIENIIYLLVILMLSYSTIICCLNFLKEVCVRKIKLINICIKYKEVYVNIRKIGRYL